MNTRFRRSHSKAQSEKTKFRRSAKWTKFRKYIKKTQKTDPITGSPLSATFNVHHLLLDEASYSDLSEPMNFIGVNRVSHSTVHFLYSAHNGWRKAVLALISILKRMEKLNSGSASSVQESGQGAP